MKASQEPKYCIVDGEGNILPEARIANRDTMQPIPDEEPIMIFRAKDLNAAGAINAYANSCQPGPHAKAVDRRLGQFLDFRDNNPDRCKEPD